MQAETIQFFAKVGIASALNIEWDLVNLLTIPTRENRRSNSSGSKKRKETYEEVEASFFICWSRKRRIHKVNGLFRYFSFVHIHKVVHKCNESCTKCTTKGIRTTEKEYQRFISYKSRKRHTKLILFLTAISVAIAVLQVPHVIRLLLLALVLSTAEHC